MSEEFDYLSDEEKLKAENDFLKMKLMLEKGATFGGMEGNEELPPQIENEFLNYIAEFEKQSQNPKYITVFDKIERPAHFKPVAEIPDTEIDTAWDELTVYLQKYGIDLDVCSPNISNRELYRFTTEELFQHEMNHMNIVGLRTAFIYDEFHPDPVYDNSRMVENDLFKDIFRKGDLFYEIHYNKNGFLFNDKLYETREPYLEMINRFKSLFDKIKLVNFAITSCDAKEKNYIVKGNYKATAKTGIDKMNYGGDFKVELVVNDMGYWDFKNIQIDGFNPA